MTDRLTQAIGLDSVGLRQQNVGDVKETIVSLGKQLSKRWYVGYERGLNATSGSWQLIYRVAQRVTVRAQAGDDNSVDLIWTLRWEVAGLPPSARRLVRRGSPWRSTHRCRP